MLIIAIFIVGKHLDSKGKLIEKSEQPSQNEIEFEELRKEMERQMGMSDDDIFGNPNGYDKNSDVKDIFSCNADGENSGGNGDGAFTGTGDSYQKASGTQNVNIANGDIVAGQESNNADVNKNAQKEPEKTGFDSNYFGS